MSKDVENNSAQVLIIKFLTRKKNMYFNERDVKTLQSSHFYLIGPKGHEMSNCHRHYGFFHFLFDVFMTILTAGFWLIWIFVREMRGR